MFETRKMDDSAISQFPDKSSPYMI